MRLAKATITVFVVVTLVLGAVTVAGAQMDEGMDDENMSDGMDGEMDDMGGSETGDGMDDGEDLPGFGVIVAGAAILLSAVGMYVRRGE